VKNSNFHIFETTASIATKFCTEIKTVKYPLWMIQRCPKQIQDGDGRNLKKLKIAITPQGIGKFLRNLAQWCNRRCYCG